MTTATVTESINFDNINLNEVDPSGMKIPLGIPVKFVITEAARKEYSNANGSGKYTNFKFTVVDNPQFSGRSFYQSIFDDKEGGKNYSAAKLRKLMDCTGVPQTGDYTEWLTDLVSERATFEAPLEERKQKDGSMRAEPNLFKAAPAA